MVAVLFNVPEIRLGTIAKVTTKKMLGLINYSLILITVFFFTTNLVVYLARIIIIMFI